MWVEDYHIDGLRMDMTLYIRSVRADGEPNLPDGWTLLQWINGEIREKHPNTLTIAEDLQHNDWITKPAGRGRGRVRQPVGRPVRPPDSRSRDRRSGRTPLDGRGRAVRSRTATTTMPSSASSTPRATTRWPTARLASSTEIEPGRSDGWFAQKRSTLAAALVFTAPGIPMLFQGQEFLEGEWFRDTVPVDWDKRDEFRGIVRLYRDLIRLRLNQGGQTRGLMGQNVQLIRVDDANNVIAFRRWMDGGPGDDVVVVANFERNPRDNFEIGFPAAGAWKLHLNSDWEGYSAEFGTLPFRRRDREAWRIRRTSRSRAREHRPVQRAGVLSDHRVIRPGLPAVADRRQHPSA